MHDYDYGIRMHAYYYCFGVVFYINMSIAHAKIFIYFTPGNHFKIVSFLFNGPVTTQTEPVYRPNRSANRWKPIELNEIRNLNLNLTSFYRFSVKPDRLTGTGGRRFRQTGRYKKLWPRPAFRSAVPAVSPRGLAGVCRAAAVGKRPPLWRPIAAPSSTTRLSICSGGLRQSYLLSQSCCSVAIVTPYFVVRV